MFITVKQLKNIFYNLNVELICHEYHLNKKVLQFNINNTNDSGCNSLLTAVK